MRNLTIFQFVILLNKISLRIFKSENHRKSYVFPLKTTLSDLPEVSFI